MIIGRQTDAALLSHSVMFELLTAKNEPVSSSHRFEGEDFNYWCKLYYSYIKD